MLHRAASSDSAATQCTCVPVPVVSTVGRFSVYSDNGISGRSTHEGVEIPESAPVLWVRETLDANAMTENIKKMYFEAQTGLIRNAKAAFSNYAQYELADTPGNRAWVEAGISRAKIGPGGFEYDRSFIANLSLRDNFKVRFPQG
jgi:hypothetical protein